MQAKKANIKRKAAKNREERILQISGEHNLQTNPINLRLSIGKRSLKYPAIGKNSIYTEEYE
ncbi:MAG: hypothetical protein CSB55_03035 [Candidatus Cloacimonadota bacterium]|nr:MAG: hypothetical protein CSB55_03035 [Candidatus Cloacimonadota bacterium]